MTSTYRSVVIDPTAINVVDFINSLPAKSFDMTPKGYESVESAINLSEKLLWTLNFITSLLALANFATPDRDSCDHGTGLRLQEFKNSLLGQVSFLQESHMVLGAEYAFAMKHDPDGKIKPGTILENIERSKRILLSNGLYQSFINIYKLIYENKEILQLILGKEIHSRITLFSSSKT